MTPKRSATVTRGSKTRPTRPLGQFDARVRVWAIRYLLRDLVADDQRRVLRRALREVARPATEKS